jgi:hypothetical protein
VNHRIHTDADDANPDAVLSLAPMLDYYRVLMADDARTLSYRRALTALLNKGDSVLDLGCGTGILSFMACSLGAGRVVAIDKRSVADAAELVAKHLGFADRISVLHQDSSTVSLPEPANMLVTETLGMLGLDEGILGSVIDARRRLLVTDARVIPKRVSVSFVPIDSPEIYDRHVGWWRTEPCGFDLSPLGVFASNSIFPVTLHADSLLSTGAATIIADLETAEESTASGEVMFVSSRSGRLHGFGGWFTAILAPGIELSSLTDNTHWHHGFLPLEHPIEVLAGTRISLRVESHSNGQVWRWHGKVESSSTVAFDQCTVFGAPPGERKRPPDRH